MSCYLQVELDALHQMQPVARLADIPESEVIAGLIRLWAWCFRKQLAIVKAAHIFAHFNCDKGRTASLLHALSIFGFLEEKENDTWRVCGASRYIKAAEGRSKGGKAAKGNLKQFKNKPPLNEKAENHVSHEAPTVIYEASEVLHEAPIAPHKAPKTTQNHTQNHTPTQPTGWTPAGHRLATGWPPAEAPADVRLDTGSKPIYLETYIPRNLYNNNIYNNI